MFKAIVIAIFTAPMTKCSSTPQSTVNFQSMELTVNAGSTAVSNNIATARAWLKTPLAGAGDFSTPTLTPTLPAPDRATTPTLAR